MPVRHLASLLMPSFHPTEDMAKFNGEFPKSAVGSRAQLG